MSFPEDVDKMFELSKRIRPVAKKGGQLRWLDLEAVGHTTISQFINNSQNPIHHEGKVWGLPAENLELIASIKTKIGGDSTRYPKPMGFSVMESISQELRSEILSRAVAYEVDVINAKNLVEAEGVWIARVTIYGLEGPESERGPVEKQTFSVFGFSLYSLAIGKSAMSNYDSEALVRTHQWGLFGRSNVLVPKFRHGDNYVVKPYLSDAYHLEVVGNQFALYKWNEKLAQGVLEPGQPDRSHEGKITWYCIGDDGWDYSFHCLLPPLEVPQQ